MQWNNTGYNFYLRYNFGRLYYNFEIDFFYVGANWEDNTHVFKNIDVIQ